MSIHNDGRERGKRQSHPSVIQLQKITEIDTSVVVEMFVRMHNRRMFSHSSLLYDCCWRNCCTCTFVVEEVAMEEFFFFLISSCTMCTGYVCLNLNEKSCHSYLVASFLLSYCTIALLCLFAITEILVSYMFSLPAIEKPPLPWKSPGCAPGLGRPELISARGHIEFSNMARILIR